MTAIIVLGTIIIAQALLYHEERKAMLRVLSGMPPEAVDNGNTPPVPPISASQRTINNWRGVGD